MSGNKSVKNAEIWNYLPDLGEDINFNQLLLTYFHNRFFSQALHRLDLYLLLLPVHRKIFGLPEQINNCHLVTWSGVPERAVDAIVYTFLA